VKLRQICGGWELAEVFANLQLEIYAEVCMDPDAFIMFLIQPAAFQSLAIRSTGSVHFFAFYQSSGIRHGRPCCEF
jgi:hypothetical protein